MNDTSDTLKVTRFKVPVESIWYAVAGIMVATNRSAGELHKGDYDASLTILFVEEEVFLSDNALCLSDLESLVGWSLLPECEQIQAIISDDGESVIVLESSRNSYNYSALIRRFVPFASAVQGKVILHASAVLVDGRVCAFIGESGAGKSTIAQQLVLKGYELYADDLLPCRVVQNRVFIPAINEKKEGTCNKPLAKVYFLQKRINIPTVIVQPMSSKKCFLLLMHNGFGEYSSTNAWKHQFFVYQKITSQISAYELTIPDDLPGIAESVDSIIEHLCCY